MKSFSGFTPTDNFSDNIKDRPNVNSTRYTSRYHVKVYNRFNDSLFISKRLLIIYKYIVKMS